MTPSSCTFSKLGVEVDPEVTMTVGDAFGIEILRARETVERLCIAKAKAEALNLLNQPYRGLRDILGYVI